MRPVAHVAAAGATEMSLGPGRSRRPRRRVGPPRAHWTYAAPRWAVQNSPRLGEPPGRRVAARAATRGWTQVDAIVGDAAAIEGRSQSSDRASAREIRLTARTHVLAIDRVARAGDRSRGADAGVGRRSSSRGSAARVSPRGAAASAGAGAGRGTIVRPTPGRGRPLAASPRPGPARARARTRPGV
jgi:hypothetical protein